MAARLRERAGVRPVSAVNWFDEDTGWADFRLCESDLEKVVDKAEKPDIINR